MPQPTLSQPRAPSAPSGRAHAAAFSGRALAPTVSQRRRLSTHSFASLLALTHQTACSAIAAVVADALVHVLLAGAKRDPAADLGKTTFRQKSICGKVLSSE